MSEVALVAAITGGSSILTSGITALVTWRVSKNSSSVELAKLHAENQRLQQGTREQERRNRQNTYHEFLDALTGVYQVLGTTTSRKTRNQRFREYNHLLSGVILFGAPRVREVASDLQQLNRKSWAALHEHREKNPDKPDPECWRDATVGLKEEFSSLFTRLADLMHEDVTRGIAD